MGDAVPRRVTLIVNPAAGGGRALRLLPQLEAAMASAGLDSETAVSVSPAAPPVLARAAIEDGRTPVACGGDGLVGQIAAVAADAGVPFGLIPAGRGNDFAAQIGLDPRRPLAAVEAIALGRVATVDLGVANGRPFCGVAGIGFDAEAALWANRFRSLPHGLVYVAAVVRTLAVYRPRRFRIVADGVARETAAWLIAVANGPCFGGGMRIAPGARCDDGRLQVVIVGPVTRPDFLLTFPKVFAGTHIGHPAIESFDAAHVRIESPKGEPETGLQADGEIVGSVPAEIAIRPRALKVLVPPDRVG